MFLSKSLWLIGLAIIATAVWGNSYYNDLGLLYRVLGVIVLFILGLFVLRFTEFGSLAFETIKQSTTEIRKVVWPNRTETTQTTLIVVGVVIIAALNLVLDFDFIEEGAENGAPKYMEWYGAFGLLVTLIWLYLEILRLLAKLNSRR